ncbi:unnamed protein product [marine sediment metagenome]|uniref:Uncharacterized protein n=1 Tax=marine sediment metagenome TaxID=412755 RepID=X1S489_9ZZZZ
MAEFIGAGPITGSITNVVIEYQGTPVTEVPEGESFDVYVHYQANNPGAYRWGTCATMITTDGKLPNFDITGEWGADASGRMKLDDMGRPGPMPDHDITLRVRLWGNQEVVGTPPPQTEW